MTALIWEEPLADGTQIAKINFSQSGVVDVFIAPSGNRTYCLKVGSKSILFDDVYATEIQAALTALIAATSPTQEKA